MLPPNQIAIGDFGAVSLLHLQRFFWLGAGTALIATSLMGVLLGRWLAQRLSARTLDIAAGIMLLAIAAWLIFDIVTL